MKQLLLLLTLTSTTLFASDNYVSARNQVQRLSNSLDNSLELTHYSFMMNKIRIRTRLEIGLEIPLIAKLKIKPEMELYFTK